MLRKLTGNILLQRFVDDSNLANYVHVAEPEGHAINSPPEIYTCPIGPSRNYVAQKLSFLCASVPPPTAVTPTIIVWRKLDRNAPHGTTIPPIT